tara:strand:+ start:4289 stop:4834 length:546 start_codon:yes stop_codon:yes gene_type:complete
MSNRLAQEILWKAIVKNAKYKTKGTLISFLKEIYIFQSLSDWQIARLSNFLYKRVYEVGEYIFEAKHPGAALFLVQKGEVDIEISKNDQNYTIATIREKECLGDMSLVDKSERSAAARVKKRAIVYALHRKDLERMLYTDPDIAAKVYRSLAGLIAERLKSMNDLFEKNDLGNSNEFQSAG